MASSVLVCVPSFDRSVKGKCAEAIGNAIERADEAGLLERVVHRYPGGYGIARARNFMARWALEEEVVDFLWMVDSDIVVPRDALVHLLGDSVDVALGYYVRGDSDEGMTNMVKPGSASNSNCYRASEIAAMAPELAPVKRGGMGCALVRTDVFGRVREPWFVYHDRAGGSALSEDYDFCKRCQDAGVKVWVDSRVPCGHIHDRVLEAV